MENIISWTNLGILALVMIIIMAMKLLVFALGFKYSSQWAGENTAQYRNGQSWSFSINHNTRRWILLYGGMDNYFHLANYKPRISFRRYRQFPKAAKGSIRPGQSSPQDKHSL